jgi:hypothetical protein
VAHRSQPTGRPKARKIATHQPCFVRDEQVDRDENDRNGGSEPDEARPKNERWSACDQALHRRFMAQASNCAQSLSKHIFRFVFAVKLQRNPALGLWILWLGSDIPFENGTNLMLSICLQGDK